MSTVIGVFRDVKSAERLYGACGTTVLRRMRYPLLPRMTGVRPLQDMEVGGEMGMGQENIADGTAWGGP